MIIEKGLKPKSEDTDSLSLDNPLGDDVKVLVETMLCLASRNRKRVLCRFSIYPPLVLLEVAAEKGVQAKGESIGDAERK